MTEGQPPATGGESTAHTGGDSLFTPARRAEVARRVEDAGGARHVAKRAGVNHAYLSCWLRDGKRLSVDGVIRVLRAVGLDVVLVEK
jgi:DNA-binding phage protein